MSRVSLRAWRGTHYIGLAELLCALGCTTADALWQLKLDDVATGPEGDNLRAMANGRRISTREIILTAFPDGQIIDGELHAFATPADSEPFLILYAVDSTEWDLESADLGTIAAIRAAFPEAVDVD